MTGYIGKATNIDRDIVSTQTQAEREDIWGEMPGKVVTFNPSTQTATIQPLYKKRLNGEPTALPELLEVPVRFPRAGGFVITTPIKPGDRVALRPQMRSTEGYEQDGEGFAASDTRSFNLSDYEAFLDGGESVSGAIPNFNADNMEMRSADGRFAMEMSEDGKFRMRGAEGNWFDLMASLAEKLAADTLVITKGSSAGSGHRLEFQAEYAAIAAKLRAMAL